MIPLIRAAGLAFAAFLAAAGSAGAVGPFWHVDTFNAANLDPMVSGNRAMWCGVPGGTPGYATAPGYGNNWDDKLYWRMTVANPAAPTTVRLRFVFNYDTQPSADFFGVAWQAGGVWTSLGQVSGSNKDGSGMFTTPAVFDQTWVVNPGQYAGPHGDQVVLRLRFLSNPSGSDQDGGYNTSGAVQVDNVRVDFNGNPVSVADFEPSGTNGGWTPHDRQAIAEYVRDNVLGGQYGNRTLWMTMLPVDQSHVARDVDPQVPDLPMPYVLNWVVMIDDAPAANFAHSVRWVVVSADQTAYAGPLTRAFPPSVLGGGGSGPRIPISCDDFTPIGCAPIDDPPSIGPGPEGDEGSCLHAVLISGGAYDALNFSRYRTNLISVYQKLREIGYAKANIDVYYSDGSPLDLDNLDGDGNHATGSDVTGSVDKTTIRDRLQALCSTLDRRRDVLFVYMTNHGQLGGDLVLWDFDDDGFVWGDEVYQPAEFRNDTENCAVCRLFLINDACYSGAFTNFLDDGLHDKIAVYTAAQEDEVSWGREYMDEWEEHDASTETMNAMHDAVVASGLLSTPDKAEGTPGNGDTFLDYCWALETCYVPWDTPFCVDDASKVVDVTICNLLNNDHTYDLSFAGDPAGSPGGCTVDGPTEFTVLDPTPVFVPSGACARVRVSIERPATLAALLDVACYTITVTNHERGNTFSCRGALWDRRDLCPEWIALRNPQFLVVNQPRQFTLRITNTGSGSPAKPGSGSRPGTVSPSLTPNPLPYTLEVVASDMSGVPNTAISLNGLPPGTPVSGMLTIPPPGDGVSVPINVTMVQSDPFFFYDLLFLADTDQDGNPEAFISLGLRETPPVVIGAAKQASLPDRLSLRAWPNPSAGTVNVELALPGPDETAVTVEVFDLLGRRVRTLIAERSAGPGSLRTTWRGEDEDGHPVANGLYMVRARTHRDDARARVLIMK